ncbi:MAG: aminotransferase [Actinobacteria bacterium]|uniref:Unannotated protein n=1 Tax=freshwater metagenome TaxID=449393 RepID=A0A6J7IVF0_9ZZZZ|nr:aminotransferase [Actinomycetota bacterium]
MADYEGIDFLAVGSLPAPRVTTADAERIARDEFGLHVSALSLGSQQDANFLLTETDGTVVGVLRIANPAFTHAEIDAQDAAAERIAEREPDIRVATLVHRDGVPLAATVETPDGPARARVLRFLEGGTLSTKGYLSPSTMASLGDLAGRSSRALVDFDHPGLNRRLQWDLQHSNEVVAHLIGHVSDPGRRERVAEAAASAWLAVLPVAGRLPRQAMHHDVADTNVTCRTANGIVTPDGILDFGDLTHSWAVGDLVVAIASVLHHPGLEPASVLPAVLAFHAVRPLSSDEVAALWPLVVVRAAVCVMSSEQQVTLDVNNHYALEAMAEEWAMFEAATEVPTAVMTALIRERLGLAGPARAEALEEGLLRGLVASEIEVLDLGWDSELMDRGSWLEPHAEESLAAAALASGAAAVVTRFAQPLLTASRAMATASPATVSTGVDLWVGEPTHLVAPWPGDVVSLDDGFELRGVDFTLAVTGASLAGHAGTRQINRGDDLATMSAGARVHLSLRMVDAPRVPALVRPEYAPGWLALVADPSPLLGLSTSHDTRNDDLLHRRDHSVASVQEHYYDSPPRIERGWRHHLLDTEARAYLDMVNNVAVLGHAHPSVADAAGRQLNRLNTNSRFNYGALVELAERLAALAPDPLDTVFLVNSGSEAADLALRLTLAATGRHDVLAVGEAYHGWTYLSDAVSTSTADNPDALSTRPEWVHVLDSPNSYRGTYRGAESWRYAHDAVQMIDALAAGGTPPATLIAEAFYGNAGGVALPDGYLSAVYSAVRRHGGLVIADEVQVGYGRLGRWFWGFEQQGVVPDVIAVAKAMGNGHPLGAVITSRDVAERYRTQGYFFSSTGGSPASSVVGLAVLDALRDEGLQANAAGVGEHLRRRLLALAERHPLIGAVHGEGLYLGVELVRDRVTLEPATEETYAICDRMLELGVVVQPTSDRMCVLKIKPPLCLDEAAADFFVDTLDRVLSEGW